MSILRLPMSMTYDSYSGPDTGAAAYRGHADGGHVESYGTLRSNHVTDVTKHGRTSTVNLLQSDQNFSEHNVGENSTVNIVLFYEPFLITKTSWVRVLRGVMCSAISFISNNTFIFIFQYLNIHVGLSLLQSLFSKSICFIVTLRVPLQL